jgi:hypothetical protein
MKLLVVEGLHHLCYFLAALAFMLELQTLITMFLLAGYTH